MHAPEKSRDFSRIHGHERTSRAPARPSILPQVAARGSRGPGLEARARGATATEIAYGFGFTGSLGPEPSGGDSVHEDRDATLPTDHGALPRWDVADLPAPPPFGLRNMLKVIGPGAIMAATSIGGGEWLVGPAAAVKYSSSIFLIATVAILLQVIFNLEAIRYTLYTGEPIYGGIMRLKPGPRFWAGVLHGDRLLPARMARPRRQRRRDAVRRLDGPHAGRTGSGHPGLDRLRPHRQRRARSSRSAARSSACSSTSPGRCSAIVFLFLIVVNLAFVPLVALVADLHGLLQLLRAAAADRLGADRRAGGDGRLRRHRQSHRDQLDPRQGLRHGSAGRRDPERGRRPRDPAVARRHGVPDDTRRTSRAGASGCATSTPTSSGCGALFCFVGMFLNVNLATAIIPHGTDLQGLAAGAYQAEYLSKIWPGFWFLTLFNGFWILFKTQLGNTDILVRTITDAVWMSSSSGARVEAGHPRDLLRDPRWCSRSGASS